MQVWGNSKEILSNVPQSDYRQKRKVLEFDRQRFHSSLYITFLGMLSMRLLHSMRIFSCPITNILSIKVVKKEIEVYEKVLKFLQYIIYIMKKILAKFELNPVFSYRDKKCQSYCFVTRYYIALNGRDGFHIDSNVIISTIRYVNITKNRQTIYESLINKCTKLQKSPVFSFWEN